MIYTCRGFTGHWGVPVAAIVAADTPDAAAALLNEQLRERGLLGDAKPETMEPFEGGVRVLSDGDY